MNSEISDPVQRAATALRAWVRPSFAVVAVTCKLSALAAFVYAIVWLAK